VQALQRSLEDWRPDVGLVREIGQRMNLPRNILPDFSEGAEAAIDYAVAFGAKIDASAHLVNVVGSRMLSAEMGWP
jgi:hypothetical protein